MPHILELFDPSKYICAFELQSKDRTVTIQTVRGEQIEGEGNRKAKKPVIHFTDWPKPLVLNKTNAKVLIALYGSDYTKWAGKRITIYPTTAKMAGEDVDAVRVRKKVPVPAVQGAKDRPLPERATTFKAALRDAKSVADVEDVWNKAAALRGALSEAEPALLDDLALTYEARAAELGE